jgi:16S rRNA (uracil1498-N3)-methyltransferase
MRRFYAAPENFHASEITLDAEQTRHLRDVLRLRAGDKINVFDGAGNEFSALIQEIDKKGARLRIQQKIDAPAPESNLALTLAVALLKAKNSIWSFRKRSSWAFRN